MKNATAIAGEEAGILKRLLRPDEKLPHAAARAFLQFDFDESDRRRMHELATKNQQDELTEEEELQLLSYLRVGLLLDLIHAKARRSLSASRRRK